MQSKHQVCGALNQLKFSHKRGQKAHKHKRAISIYISWQISTLRWRMRTPRRIRSRWGSATTTPGMMPYYCCCEHQSFKLQWFILSKRLRKECPNVFVQYDRPKSRFIFTVKDLFLFLLRFVLTRVSGGQ